MSFKIHAQHFSIKIYTINQGLPETETHTTAQDKYGYLWINTPSGLSRFDGHQFVNFSLADGLPSLQTTKVFQDSHERLWVGTGTGMAQFKNNKFETLATSDGLTNFYVFGFTELKNKKIWANTGKGAYEFEDTIWRKLSLIPGFENIMCRSTIELNGELFVSYLHDIFCKRRNGSWIRIASAQDDIFNVMSLQNGKIWVSTSDNIFEIQNHRLIPLYKNGIGIHHYFSYLFDSKNRLWLSGVNFIKVSNAKDWQHFTNVSNNQYGYASAINEDKSGNVWVNTEKGLLRIKNVEYAELDEENNIPFDGIYNIIALPDSKLIFSSGTKTGWLLYNGTSYNKIIPPVNDKDFFKDPIDAYTIDQNNSIWMITRFRKFLHFNDNALEDFSSSLHFKTSEIIYDIDYVKSRQQFFICADTTLLFGSATNLTPFIPRNTGMQIMKPIRVYELKNGLIMLFVAGKGLFCIDKANNLISLNIENGFSNNKNGLFSDVWFKQENDGNFWMAVTGLGLYEYGCTANKLPFLKNHFTSHDGLQSNTILSLSCDNQNRLWVSTTLGLDVLQKNDDGKWQIFNYVKADELGLNGSYYQKLATDVSGNVWLSTPSKVFKFNSPTIQLQKETPHVIIEKVSLAFKETDWRKLCDSFYSYYQLPSNPILKYNQNSLGINFNAVDLSITDPDVQYSYKLLPSDTGWSIPSRTKSVSFSQLPAGKYQFQVKAKDMASNWSAPATFEFVITAPFWNTWWFRSIIICVAAAIVVTIFRIRIRRIRHDANLQNQLQELEMKALKSQMNPHFIYNALNSIQALVADDKKDEGIHYIGSFSRLLRQVLDNSDNNIISLDKELETINLYVQLEALRLDMQLQYEKVIDENIITEFEKIPPLILQPFVENALWHGLSKKNGEKQVKISISINDNWLLCNITDNGIGRQKAQQLKNNSIILHQSKGINITYKRLVDYNEDPSVIPIEFFDLYDVNKNPSGTSVIVRIKRKSFIQVD